MSTISYEQSCDDALVLIECFIALEQELSQGYTPTSLTTNFDEAYSTLEVLDYCNINQFGRTAMLQLQQLKYTLHVLVNFPMSTKHQMFIDYMKRCISLSESSRKELSRFLEKTT